MLGTKAVVIGLGALAVVTVIGLGYMHYKGLIDENGQLRENAGTLETALETERASVQAALSAIDKWSAAQAQTQQLIRQMAEASEAATAEQRRINDIFARHELERLALERPDSIERIINSGTADALRMLERATHIGGRNPDGGEAATEDDVPAPAAD